MTGQADLEKFVYAATSQHDQLASMLLEFARKPMTDKLRSELLEAASVYRIAAEGIYTCVRIIAGAGAGPDR